ncbi:hypothetical protein D0Z07_3880 [Hyphodiscus hymeniophilus]|uniref:Uncharacterized protein n=1 Tax=Hyphodiscus hymeniophilus TaxID=353542 RepID=A0A9P6VL65_9HELO|nr:hypothetical protein D0Z07_3880 [Hyphodiscus hymeniophilus]
MASERGSSAMYGPWRLFRVVFKIILFGTLAWFLLALLWAFLPSFVPEHDGDNGTDYATSVLRSRKTLTRIYDSKILHTQYDREGFALEYKLDADRLTVSVGGHTIPILNDMWADGWDGDITGDLAEHINVSARIGDTDGANLPWFPFADAVLLFWWIDKERVSVELSLQWRAWPTGIRRLEIHTAAQPWDDPLLAVEIWRGVPSTIKATVPEMPLSSSPTSTYPLRVAIIHVIAPTAIFVNYVLGTALGGVVESVVTALFVVFIAGFYGIIALAVIFSFWRCLRGPSFEDTVERIQNRLETLGHNERLQLLKTDVLRENLEALCRNERFMTVVNVCRNGWHPERDRAIAAEEAADIERAVTVKEKGSKAEEVGSTVKQ